MGFLSYLRPDRFTVALVAVAIIATLLPTTGGGIPVLKVIIAGSIALLFFLQGARLSRNAIIDGAVHWRLHLMVFAATFVMFPMLGVLFSFGLGSMLAPGIGLG